MKDAITASVARLYETFPYPRYPLLARPRWQEGYLVSAQFAARLRSLDQLGSQIRSDASDHRHAARYDPAPRQEALTILVGGSGEILPYIVRRWEPWPNRVLSLDLSRASLIRARFRLGPLAPRTNFVHAELGSWLERRVREGATQFDHIDAYGVLHHMANPSQALELCARSLAPGGTMRLMVYNSPARAWIHEIQAILRILRVSPFVATDRQFARRLIENLGHTLPSLGERLAQMGSSILRNEARFVDAFLHTREARLSIDQWQQMITKAGLEAFALFDRYAELDDLANPLWRMPDWQALSERAADGRFENNLELFLTRRGESRPKQSGLRHPYRLLLTPPPRLWFNYQETRGITLSMRWRLWHAFLRGSPLDPWLSRLTGEALQRLTRLGAILPHQLTSGTARAIGLAKLTDKMDIMPRQAASACDQEHAVSALQHALAERGCENDARIRRACLARLERLSR